MIYFRFDSFSILAGFEFFVMMCLINPPQVVHCYNAISSFVEFTKNTGSWEPSDEVWVTRSSFQITMAFQQARKLNNNPVMLEILGLKLYRRHFLRSL